MISMSCISTDAGGGGLFHFVPIPLFSLSNIRHLFLPVKHGFSSDVVVILWAPLKHTVVPNGKERRVAYLISVASRG